ncbi:MAG: ABC transporter substrate-binding protein [Acidobacteria bacterium]|nr:ABC transporter substrate-binding protein [Acidobacteriota bacterium]
MDDQRPTRGQQVARRPRTPWEGAGSCYARAICIASGIVWALSALACVSATPPPPAAGPATIVIGIPQSRQLDPLHGVRSLANWLALERLTGNDASGRTSPRLVESWSEVDNGLTWRLVLKSQLRYQDGTPLVAADVKRQIDEARGVPAGQTLRVCVPDIRDISVAGDREVVIRLNRRCAFLLDDLDMTITRPAVENRPDVGTGPFAITSSTRDEIVLGANPYYYLGKPAISRVVVKAYDTLRTAWAEMMRGHVDFLWEVGPDTAEFLRDQSSVQVRSYLSYYAYTIIMNSARPIFRDPTVRRALNIGVNRAELLQQALKGQGLAGDDAVWPSFWARDSSVPTWRYDPAKAAGLLETARRGSGIRTSGLKAGAPALEFTCLLPANFAIYERLALLVQRQLRLVNVEMRIEALPADVYNRRIAIGDFDAVLTNLVGGPYRTIHYWFWHSPGVSKRWNFWGYQDAAVDAALEQMRDAPDDNGTRTAMRALSLALRENPPAIVLAWGDTVQAVSRRFALPDGAAGRDALHSLSRWRMRNPGGVLP